MNEFPKLDVGEFHALGLISEINRQILHPLGLALAVVAEADGTVSGFGEIWDYRADPEGLIFGDDYAVLVAENARKVAALLAERSPARLEALGYVVQPA